MATVCLHMSKMMRFCICMLNLQVLEAAFKNETVGLATREEFLNKKATLKDRQIEEAKRKRERDLQLAGMDLTGYLS